MSVINKKIFFCSFMFFCTLNVVTDHDLTAGAFSIATAAFEFRLDFFGSMKFVNKESF